MHRLSKTNVLSVLSAVVLVGGPTQLADVLASESRSSGPGVVDLSVVGRAMNGPTVGAGRLVDSAGRGTAGIVAVIAWPSEEWNRSNERSSSIPTPTVGWGRAGVDGKFRLTVDPGLVPAAYYNSDGRVNLEAVGWTATKQGSWSFPARVDGASAEAANFAIRATRAIVAPHGGLAPASSSSARPDVGNICYWTLEATSDVWTVIGWSYPYGSDTGWMHSGSTQSVTDGVAVSSSGTYATWTANGSSTSTTGVTFTWSESIAYRDFRVGQQFGKYHLYCSGTGYANQYKEAFYRTIGSYTTAGLGSPPAWSYCYSNSAGVWTRDSSSGQTSRFSAGVQIATVLGINLFSDSNYSSSRTLSYRLVTAGTVCGSNDVPAYASQVKTSR